MEEVKSQSTGFGIAGFILGLLGFLSLFSFFGVLFAVLAIIFSVVQFKKNSTKLAVIGLVLGIIGVIISIITIALVFFGLFTAVSETSRVSDSLDPSDCEKIEGIFKKSATVDCYIAMGIKLADPTVCEKIIDELPYSKSIPYCKAVASRDINNCDSLESWKVGHCKAILTQDISYCDPEKLEGCKIVVEQFEPYI